MKEDAKKSDEEQEKVIPTVEKIRELEEQAERELSKKEQH